MMGRCSYCGKPAGFLRTQHAECSERYHRAMAMMPTFFAKFLESQVPAARFSELLRGAAQAAFVRPEELARLAVAEIGKTVDTLRAQQPPHPGEIQRIAELMDQLGPGVADDAGLNEKLAKATVLAELHEGRLPDAVTVAGPLPIRLGRGESVLWIFNRVEAFSALPPTPLKAELSPVAGPAGEAPDSPPALRTVAPSAPDPGASSSGDMVVTNRNLHLLLDGGRQERLPIAAVSSLEAYPHGIQVSDGAAGTFAWMLLLDDPPFAMTVISRLRQLASA